MRRMHTHTCMHVSFPSLRLSPEGLVLKWHRGGGWVHGLVEFVRPYSGGRKEEGKKEEV